MHTINIEKTMEFQKRNSKKYINFESRLKSKMYVQLLPELCVK